MKTDKPEFVNLLPKTSAEIRNGGLYVQAVRCGKSNCKCASGELHAGYWYFFTRIDGKLKKRYVRKSARESFARVVEEAAAKRRASRQLVRRSNELLREIRSTLREMQ